MKSVTRVGLFSLLALFGAPHAAADSPVWRVSNGNRVLYLGGTIHLLTPADYPLPRSFDRAYADSQRLVLEADMQRLQSPEFQQTMLATMMYADGRTLDEVLSRKTFARLEAHLASRGVPIESVLRFKPGMLSMTLTVVELQRLGLVGTGVDVHFGNKALSDGKALQYLETAEQQLQFLASLGEGQEDELIDYTLKDIDELPGLMRSIKDAWRSGDMRALEALGLTPLMDEFPAIHDILLANRNRAWLPHIEAMLGNEEVELVLVGALHLVGEEGLLNQLAGRGYTVQEVD